MSNQKKIKKSIESLEKQIERHKDKIKSGKVSEVILDYWEKEIEIFEREIEKKKKKLEG